jgi:hypothetical protein
MARLEPTSISLIMVPLWLGPTAWLRPRARQCCSVVSTDCRVPGVDLRVVVESVTLPIPIST